MVGTIVYSIIPHIQFYWIIFSGGDILLGPDFKEFSSKKASQLHGDNQERIKDS